MKLLIIDTTTQPARLALAEGKAVIAQREVGPPRELSRQLMPELQRMLADHSWQPSDLSVVGVVNGPGSFTALRIGVATANALALATAIPVAAVTPGSLDHVLQQSIDQLQTGRTTAMVLPQYGKEPTITKPKRTSAASSGHKSAPGQTPAKADTGRGSKSR